MRLRLVIGIVLTALAVSSPSWAWADGAPWGFGSDPGLETESHKGHLFKGTLDLAIWTVVVFLVLLFVLRKFAWKPLLEGLDLREKSIHSAMEEAKSAREEAGRLRQDLQAEMNKASEKIRLMMEEARRNAEQLAADLMAKGKADLQAERERLNREVATSRDQALREIWEQAATLATLISAKTIRRHLSPDDHRQLLDEALVEFRQSAQERKQDYDSVRA
jgi:F-type H+-transporting ATPase subunit b